MAYTDAILGSIISVQTLRGTANLVIPPGTQHGAVLRLAGHGIEAKKAAGSGPKIIGSHLYEVVVRLPLEIDAQERRILEQLVVATC